MCKYKVKDKQVQVTLKLTGKSMEFDIPRGGELMMDVPHSMKRAKLRMKNSSWHKDLYPLYVKTVGEVDLSSGQTKVNAPKRQPPPSQGSSFFGRVALRRYTRKGPGGSPIHQSSSQQFWWHAVSEESSARELHHGP